MRRILATTGIVAATGMALMLAVPAFAQTVPNPYAQTPVAHGDAQLQYQLDWQKLVARANADREQHEEANAPAYAAAKGVTATDATQSRFVTVTPTVTDSSCPASATSIAGGPAHGTDCLPGGR